MKIIKINLLIIVLLFITSCTSISYLPSLTLETSTHTIDAVVQVDNFVDKSPFTDKEKVIFGISLTDENTLVGNLTTGVTNAVVNDFSMNGVFKRVGKKIDEPDLIIKGEIYRFYGKSKLTSLGWLTIPINIIWFLGLPIYSFDGEVTIIVSIYSVNGDLLGNYTGKASFSEGKSIYNNQMFALPTKVNRIFNQSISQIRDQIIADAHKF